MEPSPEQISSLADQLSNLARDIASAPDPMTRKLQTSNFILQAKKTIWNLQEPLEALTDQVVSTYSVSATQALMELGVWDILPAQGTASVTEIAQKANAPEELIIRLMRQCTCVHIATEVSLHEYAHNRLSVALSSHFGLAGKHFFAVAMDEMLPAVLALNRHIRAHGAHSLLHTYTHTPHSTYYNLPGLNFWEVLNSSPSRINTFMSGLSMWSAMHPVVAMYPFATALETGNSPDRVLAVDIGGGRGTAMLELRKNCPHLQGDLILQDRPYILDELAEGDIPGVTKMVHDFFTPQPVKNAQMYYIRRVMHDWQDTDAVRILENVVPAMAPDSRIIVSDMALPEPVTERDSGAIWLDMMMLMIGGKERTIRDWEMLGEKAGLKCIKVWQEKERFGPLCVVEYMLPEAPDGAPVGEIVANRDKAEGEKAVADGQDKFEDTNGNREAEMGETTPRLAPVALEENGTVPTSDAVPSTQPGESSTNAMNLDGSTGVDDQEPELRERDVDWEERAVVGDREQSVEPGPGA